jgi:hypothetical protein
MPPEAKKLITRLLKSEVKQNVGSIWFDHLLIDLMDYGDKNTDMAMALGLCLLYKLELFDDIVEDYEDESYYQANVLDSMLYYDIDNNGVVSIKSYGGEEYYYEMPEEFPDDDVLTESQKEEMIKRRTDDARLRKQINSTSQISRQQSLLDLIEKEILRSNHYTTKK